MEDIKREIKQTLTEMSVYFLQTHGLPLEYFNDKIKTLNMWEQCLLCEMFKKKRA